MYSPAYVRIRAASAVNALSLYVYITRKVALGLFAAT